jgi:hypothetical protein
VVITKFIPYYTYLLDFNYIMLIGILYLFMLCVCVERIIFIVGSGFTTGLRSRIFGRKSNRRKTSTIKGFKLR